MQWLGDTGLIQMAAAAAAAATAAAAAAASAAGSHLTANTQHGVFLKPRMGGQSKSDWAGASASVLSTGASEHAAGLHADQVQPAARGVPGLRQAGEAMAAR